MTDKDSPTLDLPLDQIVDDAFVDRVRSKQASVAGDVIVLPEGPLGAAARFGALSRPDSRAACNVTMPADDVLVPSDAFTVTAWVNVARIVKGKANVFGVGPPEKFRDKPNTRRYPLWSVHYTPQEWVFTSMGYGFWESAVRLHVGPQTRHWYHLAFVLETYTSWLYLHDSDGSHITSGGCQRMSGPGAVAPLVLGFAEGWEPGGDWAAHDGSIAGVRIYPRTLQKDEIEARIRKDLLEQSPAFRSSHPIDFELLNVQGQPELAITDGIRGEQLTLRISNAAAEPLLFREPPAESAGQHHLALSFRPGTLSAEVLAAPVLPEAHPRLSHALRVEPANEWGLRIGRSPTSADEIFYLLYKGEHRTLSPGETRHLTLHGVSAAPGNGACGTTVQLGINQIVRGEHDLAVAGTRTQYLHITNRAGSPNVPLYATFIGRNTILNDGSPRSLRIGIYNLSRDTPLTFKANSTRLILSLEAYEVSEVGPDREWVLLEQCSGVQLAVQGFTSTPQDSRHPLWWIEPTSDLTLPPQKSLELTITGITTTLPAGHGRIYIDYENVPGYWSGRLVCVAERSPIAHVTSVTGSVQPGEPEETLATAKYVQEQLALLKAQIKAEALK